MQRPHRGGGVARHRRPGRKTPPCRPQRHSRISGSPQRSLSFRRKARRRAILAARRASALHPHTSRFRRDAGRRYGTGRLFRLAADAKPARRARLHVRRGCRHGQFRAGGLPGNRCPGRSRGDGPGTSGNLQRNRTAAPGADARRGTFAGEEHHDGRGDAHPRRTVRHRRRDDRKPPLRHEQRCH